MRVYTSKILVVSAAIVASVSNATHYYCDSPIYCDGPLLRTVQLARLFPDSKTFVDMPTKKPLDQVLAAFDAIGGEYASKTDIKAFVLEYFDAPGSEMVHHAISPRRLDRSPSWFSNVEDTIYRGWIDILNNAWANLTFEYDYSKLCKGCVSSILRVERPFVVPGGRFREFYYWDTYFVVRGLLLSELDELASNMILNILDFVDIYGFMPNGARIYYLNRSQPPLLTEMVKAYYEKTNDDAFLARALPTLDKEYKFWQTNTTVTMPYKAGDNVSASSQKHYRLNRYIVLNESPRPESYSEDWDTVFSESLSPRLNVTQQKDLFANLATGAETGWDYTARWTRAKESHDPHGYDILRTLNTRNIIPVDLNAILYGMESTLASWHKQNGDRKKAKYYKRQAAHRLDAMEKYLWNDDMFAFYDYNLTSQAQDVHYTPAGLYPLWMNAIPERIKDNPSILAHIFDQTRAALDRAPGILATSLYTNTSLQWDWPNGWPPLQYIAIKSMLNMDALLGRKDPSYKQGFKSLARTLALRNAASAFCSWYKTGGSIPGTHLQKLPGQTDDGHMFEKFDVRYMGLAGSGGEYTVQVGFGWTNAVALWILNVFPDFQAPDCNEIFNYSVKI
ncbi:putative neutral trehalase [Dichotomocladium elegans]|nr:putative neutral trehalase [Dichotomocladium elegans]